MSACLSHKEETDKHTFDIPDFENGDLIYRHGNGIFSDYFMNMSKHEQLYSHGGIISKENDSIFVIHSEASEFTGIGGVKKEPLSIFLQNVSTWGVYRLEDSVQIRDSIVIIASEYLEKNTPFDFEFDNTSDDKLYCTELLAISINKATQKTTIKTENAFRGKPYYALDDTYFIPEIKAIYQEKPQNK